MQGLATHFFFKAGKLISEETLSQERNFSMLIQKKRLSRRISVWTLIFSLLLAVFTSALILPARAEMFSEGVTKSASDAADNAGDAIENAGDAVKNAVDDMADMDGDGRVNDSDGIIGNESREAETEENSGMSAGWIGAIIAILIAVVVIVLIVILVPKKKHR